MKRMTLNIHSHGKGNVEEKQRILAEFLRAECPNAVALQEVCQTADAPEILSPQGFYHASGIVPLRADNFLLGVHEALGKLYEIAYLPIKRGYGIYDEGVALLCRFPIGEAKEILLTPDRPYGDWRRRAALAVCPTSGKEWTVSLHTSWWEEGFLSQWEILSIALSGASSAWVMGDFNVTPKRLEREGDPISLDGYGDAFALAREKDLEDTVSPVADGWRGREAKDGLRIDQIRCRPSRPLLRYRRIFDGRCEPILSDHFGIMIEDEEREHEARNT
ncbi:MAG: endonuclease/exonuclease/phosphatase family protein [Clostridia bacterium]|nr:endonuclease/exonuclease/phosphatase family protein [Clostridia bacterium]